VALTGVAGMAAGIAVYFVVQAVLVGVYRGLATGTWTFSASLGSWSDNVFIVYTLLLATLATVVAGFAPLLLGAMAVVAIRCTRDEHRKSQLAAEREPGGAGCLARRQDGSAQRTRLRTALGGGAGPGPRARPVLGVPDVRSGSLQALEHPARPCRRDLLLRAVADTVRANVRPTDLVCRGVARRSRSCCPTRM